MHPMQLKDIDLNLAVVLQTLLDERSVSRAARRLGLSQSATSHALARLRELLKDPLFVRTSRGLAPTARAEAMAGTLASALACLEASLFSQQEFDPMRARRTFHVGTSDYVEHVIMAPLLGHLASAAPNIDVWARPSPEDAATALAQGQLDILFGTMRSNDRFEGLYQTELWSDRLVCAVRRGHPLMQGKLTLKRFAEAQHALIAPGGYPRGIVDDALERRGHSRRIAFMTPNFLVAPQIVSETDLVITLAERVATTFARTLPLVLFEPPLALASFRIDMFWHERRHADPAHRFLREVIERTATTLGSSA